MAATKTKPERQRSAVRIERFEVARVTSGTWQEATFRWTECARQSRAAFNAVWRRWIVWHTERGSALAIRDWLNTPKEKRGKIPVEVLPAALMKAIRADVTAAAPDLNGRSRELLVTRTAGTIKNRKSADSSLSGWINVLLNNEGVPSAKSSQPILFDTERATIRPPSEPGKNWRLSVRLDCIAPAEGKKVSTSHCDEIELLTRGGAVGSRRDRKFHRCRLVLERIESGEYKFCGSMLVRDNIKGKWFVMLSYQQPAAPKADVDPNKSLVLSPGRKEPWLVLASGRLFGIGGYGHAVAAKRRDLFMNRRERQEHYRTACGASKGHGRKRALRWMPRMQHAWDDFCSTANHQTATAVMKLAVEHGCGRVVYLQPADRHSGTRFLATAGKQSDRDQRAWPFFKMASNLQYRAQALGITVEIRKQGERRSVKSAAPKAKARRKGA